jgi:hypothetical protein
MNRKTVFLILGVLCIVASIAMYMIGKDSSHLSELKDYWWMPLPLAAIFLLLSSRSPKTN